MQAWVPQWITLAAIFAMTLITPAASQPDPLPSWNPGPARNAIMDFVGRVVTQGSADFVKQEERIAVFDNDGTLWGEQPFYFQAAFAFDRIREMALDHPAWSKAEPYKSVIAGDMKGLAASGEKGLAQLIAATHSGITVEEFREQVGAWLRTARHPRFQRPYHQCIYQPMLEVLSFLRANGFKTFIVSGGGVEFIRVFAEETYGIPPEQVIGSSGMVRYDLRDSTPVLIKDAKVEFIDDGPGKPVGINRFIGRRPIMAFGNSDGDYQMLQWTTSGPGPRFGLLVHHTDGEREYAYDRQSPAGKLDRGLSEAPGRGWLVVDMKRDWKTVFPASAGGLP